MIGQSTDEPIGHRMDPSADQWGMKMLRQLQTGSNGSIHFRMLNLLTFAQMLNLLNLPVFLDYEHVPHYELVPRTCNHYPRPGLNLVINPCKLAILPTTFLVIVMQFSIGKMIKRRQNLITVCQIDGTGYNFHNWWA